MGVFLVGVPGNDLCRNLHQSLIAFPLILVLRKVGSGLGNRLYLPRPLQPGARSRVRDVVEAAAPLPPVDDPARLRNSPVGDGDPAVEALLAGRYSVPPEHVLFVPGSTLGNFVVLTLLVGRGDRVLVEAPVYENLPGLVRLLGGEVVTVRRDAKAGYRIDPDDVESALADGVRTVFLTDLHNPTGARLPEEALEAIRASALRHGARVVLDEVYLDFVADAPVTAYRSDDPSVLVTSSLTKVYGLGSLRTGWILAPPDFRERAARLIDYLTVLPPSASASAAEHVLSNLTTYRDRALDFARTSRERLAAWAAERGDVDYVAPAGGLVAFPRFAGIDDASDLCEWLRTERDTLVVPGRFFGDPARVRLAPLGSEEDAREGLRRLAEGVDRFRSC